ncbi:hypothetical protein ACS0TY_030230 [Phlomoides rotata]
MISWHEEYLLNLHVLGREEELEGERGYQLPLKPSPKMRRFHQKKQNHHHGLILLQPLQVEPRTQMFLFGAVEAQDMEESTDNALTTIIADQLELFRKEVEVMRKQIHDRVPTASLEVKINTLTNGLRDGDLFSSLAKKLVATFDDLLLTAEKYITLEEKRKDPEKKQDDKGEAPFVHLEDREQPPYK